MTDTVRQVYPDLPAKDREIYRTILTLSMLLLTSMQEQRDDPESQIVNEKET